MNLSTVTILLALACSSILQSHGDDAKPLPTSAPARITLSDQFDAPQTLSFPATNITLLTIADRKGSKQVAAWTAALKLRYAGRIAIYGLADLGDPPGFVRGRIRKGFQEAQKYPVMLDWSGKICAQFGYQKDVANIILLDRKGVIRARFAGAATPSAVAEAGEALDKLLLDSLGEGTARQPLEQGSENH